MTDKMFDRRSDHLRGLTLDELRRSSTTSTPPNEYIRQNTPPDRSGGSSYSFTFSPPTTAFSTLTVPERSLSSPIPFTFGAGFIRSMVQERDQARNPLAPSQARTAPNMFGTQKSPIDVSSSPPAQDDTPTFGRPTALNTNASPAAKVSARPSDGQKVIRRSNDNYSNLFSKKRPGDIGYHKPPALGNPLANINRDVPKPFVNNDLDGKRVTGNASAGISQTQQPTPTYKQEDVFAIAKPSNFPAPTWRPAAPPTFSSKANTNPFYVPQVKPTIVSQEPVSEGFNDREVFGNDPFGTADPMLYLDAKQAEENIKALLEAAMDDEDDKPRTRRKKKELAAKLNDLTEKMQNMDVRQEDSQPEEEELDDGTREGLKVKLLPHQIDGVEWMRNKEIGTKKVKGILPKGGILADDMGLGKTIQSLALILDNPRPSAEALEKSKLKMDPKTDRATLVVAPLALIKQWEAEIKDRIDVEHALSVRVHHGPARTKSYKDLRKFDVVITTYQTLTSEHADGAALFGVNWYRIILDEAHSIKNRNAKATKAACALNAEYRWCLTGTPMQNGPDELQSLINFLRIKPYDNLAVWREQISKPMTSGRGGLAIRRLRAFLGAFMKRRTKDVLKQDGALKNGQEKGSSAGFKIVQRTVECVSVEFSEQEQAFYQRLEDRTDKSLERMMEGNKMSYASALVLLMRLRQACNHPHLLGEDLSKEQDASRGSQTPSRKGSRIDPMDDIANMLGGLSVETRRCEVCQIDLSKDDVEEGMIRCTECEEDVRAAASVGKLRRKKEKKVVKKERKTNRRIVVDSDDEEEEEKNEEDSSLQQSSDVEEEEYTSEETDTDEYDENNYLSPSIASSTKIRHLLKILKNDSGTHKYIVFSFFTSMLDLIEPFLKRHNLRYTRYDGAMRNDAREASLESLRKNSDVRILLCSLRAGSLGLNLTAASRVVILEPFWNPFVEEQAIDRVHRLNQTQDVIVHKLTIKGTVEERIVELQERKRLLAKHTIEGQKGEGAGTLSLKEMMKLFNHDSVKDAKLDMIGMKDGRSLLDRDSESTASSRPQGGGNLERQRITSKNPVRATEHPVFGRRWD